MININNKKNTVAGILSVIHDTKGRVFTLEKSTFCYSAIIGVCTDNAYRKHFKKDNFENFHNIRVNISERLTYTFKVIPKH